MSRVCQRMIVAWLVCASLLLSVVLSVTSAAPQAVAVRAVTTPRIDGLLNDACWQDAQPLSGFVAKDIDEAAALAPEVRFAYDDARLYVSARCPEGVKVAPIADEHRGRDSWAIFGRPNVEILLDTDGDRRGCMKLAFAPSGDMLDSRVSYDSESGEIDRDDSWNIDLIKAIHVDGQEWTLEVAIPLGMLYEGGPMQSRWGMNVGKIGPEARNNGTHIAVWSKGGLFFDVPTHFGTLIGFDVDFSGFGAVSMEMMPPDRIAAGRNAVAFSLAVKQQPSDPLELLLTSQGPDGVVAEQRRTVTATPPSVATTMPVTFDQAGEYLLEAKLISSAGAALAYARKTVECPALLEAQAEDPRYGPYLFPDMDQQEIVLSVQVGLAEGALRTHRLQVEFLDVSGKVLFRRDFQPVVASTFAFDMPVMPVALPGLHEAQKKLARLPLGRYQYRISLLNSNGLLQATRIIPLLVLDNNPYGGSTVRIDQLNNLVVDGKRLFPIGMYWRSDTGLREMGFNSCNHWATGRALRDSILPVLKSAHRAGLHNIAGANQYDWRNWDLPLDAHETALLRQRAIEMSAEPAYTMCEIEDEPGPGPILDLLEAAGRVIKDADPYHPTMILEYKRDAFNRIGEFVDIVFCDPYEREAVSRVMKDIDLMQQAVDRRKPVMATICHATRGHLSAHGVRAQTYTAIIHGAKGIFYFAWKFGDKGGIADDPPRLAGVTRCAREMSLIHDVLVAPDATLQPPNRMNQSVHSLIRVHQGYGYLFTVNTAHGPTDATYDLSELSTSAPVDVLFEGRQLTPDNATHINDTYIKLDTHIYRFPLKTGLYPDNGYGHLSTTTIELDGVVAEKPGRGWWDYAHTSVVLPGQAYVCYPRGIKLEEIEPISIALTGITPGRYYLAIRCRPELTASVRDDTAGGGFITYPASAQHWAGIKEIEVPQSGTYRLSLGAGDGKTSYGTIRLHHLGAAPRDQDILPAYVE